MALELEELKAMIRYSPDKCEHKGKKVSVRLKDGYIIHNVCVDCGAALNY